MMLPLVARLFDGRVLARAAGAAGFLALIAGGFRDSNHGAPAVPTEIWTSGCTARLNHVRAELRHYSRDFRHAEVRTGESTDTARVELILPPQYMARIEYRVDQDEPPVFDWEEAPTPIAGSFALHRRVGRFDLTIVADDSDERGLRFAATMQPLLDQCLMDAAE